MDRSRGFSDLAFGLEGDLYALATIPDPGRLKQSGALFRLDGQPENLKAVQLALFEGRKPEGLWPQNDGRIIVVFDADEDRPEVVWVKAEAGP